MFGYRILHVLLHPWIIISESYRHLRWAWQRVFRGWDDRVTYGIDWHLSENMPAWIKRMKEYGNSVPFDMTAEEWWGILDEIADGFRAGYRLLNDDFPAVKEMVNSRDRFDSIIRDDAFMEKFAKQREEALVIFNRGMEMFVQHFFSLWD